MGECRGAKPPTLELPVNAERPAVMAGRSCYRSMR